MKAIITFLLIFCVIVVFHEFGHFFFAKRSGILVREFAIGMGPKIFAHTGKDGTVYTIRILDVYKRQVQGNPVLHEFRYEYQFQKQEK